MYTILGDVGNLDCKKCKKDLHKPYFQIPAQVLALPKYYKEEQSIRVLTEKDAGVSLTGLVKEIRELVDWVECCISQKITA